jgi:hypothetical protein
MEEIEVHSNVFLIHSSVDLIELLLVVLDRIFVFLLCEPEMENVGFGFESSSEIFLDNGLNLLLDLLFRLHLFVDGKTVVHH